VSWYVKVRWIFMLALGISGIVPSLVGQGLGQQTLIEVLILGGGLAYNGVFWFFSHRSNKSYRYYEVLGAIQVLSDIFLISYLLFSHGGIESRSIVAYAIPILAAGALFGQKMNYAAAGISSAIYVLILLLDWTRIVPSPGAEFQQWHQDGTFYITSILFYPVTLMVISLMSDFIQRLLAEEKSKVEAKATALNQAQAIAHLGSWEMDVATGIITLSDELYRILGIEEKDPKTNSEAIQASIHPDDRDRLNAITEKALKDHRPYEFEHRIRRPDGSERTLRAMGQVELSAFSQPVKMFGVALDITDMRSAEKSAEQRASELEKFNELMIGRELKMAELKERIKVLEQAAK
jgi:PAS domain S-box-containing protein